MGVLAICQLSLDEASPMLMMVKAPCCIDPGGTFAQLRLPTQSRSGTR